MFFLSLLPSFQAKKKNYVILYFFSFSTHSNITKKRKINKIFLDYFFSRKIIQTEDKIWKKKNSYQKQK